MFEKLIGNVFEHGFPGSSLRSFREISDRVVVKPILQFTVKIYWIHHSF